MGSEDNRKRAKWQDYSGNNAGVAEKSFYEVFKELFKETNFRIRPNPQEFKNIYLDVELSKEVLAQIYNVSKEKIKKHGIIPDYAIDNLDTKKTIYIEVKRQDGWVEGKVKIEVEGYKCERCGHEWIPRSKGEPAVCPECKSPYWNKPRKRGKKK
jgi:predicted Zn-ribbon and HTH transcriptional regulator